MKLPTLKKSALYGMMLLTVFVLSSCDGNFLDVNDSPNTATSAPGGNLFSEASAVLQSNRNIELGPTVSFFTQAYASDNSNGGLFLNQERFFLGPNDLTITNNFGGIYTSVLNNLTLALQGFQEEEGNRDNAIAQTRLLKSYTFWYLTTLFGDIPYSEANDPDISDPKFDSQQDVFAGIINNIDKAISEINTSDQSGAITDNDLWYSGNMNQWLKFANSLKLRVLMYQYNTDPSVKSDIASLLSSSELVEDNADNFEFPYGSKSGRENQLYQLAKIYAGGQPLFFSAGKQMVDVMNANSDPRRKNYYDKNADGKYAGVPAGDFAGDIGQTYSTLGSNVTVPTFPGRILTASETLLYEAEFYAKNGSPNKARTKLEAGMRASISDFDDLSAEAAISQSNEDTYVSTVLANYSSKSNAGKIELIQLQQYVDSYEKVPENWGNWKRTHVPDLDAPKQGALGNSIIKRLPVSGSEISSNDNAPSEQLPLDKNMSYEK